MTAIPGDGLRLRVEFDSEVFDPNDVVVLVDSLQRVLKAMVADPMRRLAAIDVLDDVERARLDDWTNTAALAEPVRTTASIPEVFAARVTRAPNAMALTCMGLSLSYRELDNASNRLAQKLVLHGASPGRRVALLLLPRCTEAIVAMLAVLKTGAAYVPIDPAHSAARMAFVLADAKPIAVITTAALRGRLDSDDVLVVDVADPALGLASMQRCRCRRLMRSRT